MIRGASIINHHGGGRFVTVFVPGLRKALVATEGSTPNFDTIYDAVVNGPDHLDARDVASVDGISLIDLFDLSEVVQRKLEDKALSAHVRVQDGEVLFDGAAIHSSLADQIIRFLEENVEDWKPLVRFLENVRANPSENSRVQLYDWVASHDLTITDDGRFVAYKGVRPDRFSTHSGHAIVDGQEINGRVPNEDGSTIEMPRSEVQDEPGVACSTGLHVGTHSYASDYGQVQVEVHVNPADVVSVPTDGAGEKVRVCRYTVIGTIESAYTTPVRPSLDPTNYTGHPDDPREEEDEYDECEDCSAEVEVGEEYCDDCADDRERAAAEPYDNYNDEPGL